MHTLFAGLLALATPATFVAPDAAARLVADGAMVLDARGDGPYKKAHLPGAQPIDWTDLRGRRATWSALGRNGRLDDDVAKVAATLAALGVDDARPVLVYGDARTGFGEEGRIAWTLDYLGHPDVRILDGGLAAWRAAGRPIQTGSPPARTSGRFTARPRPELRALLPMVQTALARGGVVLDVRTDEEWRGATLYHEPRGGHLPGARHLAWTDLLDGGGRLLPPAELRARLQRLGIDANGKQPVITYCTGGVRSAFAAEVLRSVGVPARNYDGGFFEWSLAPDLPVAR